MPALTKAGCNQGACHGTPTGKNGFRLSLRGYDAALDFQTLARENGTRRTNPFEPESSLILLKGTGLAPHEGGKRMGTDDVIYRVLRDWVAAGVRPDPAGTPALVGLVVTPPGRMLDDPAREQQLVVRARFADGSTRDVTRLARYGTTDATVAGVDDAGRVVKKARGETTILVSFGHLVATVRLTFREPVPGLVWVDPPENNFIDGHVFAKLKLLRIPPSGLSDDAQFCRRVYLDVIGLVPTPEEVVSFLEDDRPDKRARLIDALLERPEYVDFWTLKWADRLGCNRRFMGVKGAIGFHRWIRDQIALNVPLDQFVRTIVTAKGPNFTHPPPVSTDGSATPRMRSRRSARSSWACEWVAPSATTMSRNAGRRTTTTAWPHSSARSGTRTGLRTSRSTTRKRRSIWPPTPRSGSPDRGRDAAQAAGWRAGGAEGGRGPPREARRLARLALEPLLRQGGRQPHLVPPDGPRHRRAGGRLPRVEPAGVCRAPGGTRRRLRRHGFDVKRTIRLILNSRAYQLSSLPNDFNAADTRYFSHATVRMLSAEQLLDSACWAAGVSEKLFNLPPGTTSAQVPDCELVHPFLKDFGQPARSDACECERGADSTLEQVLQLIGGRTLHSKVIARDNRIGELLNRARMTPRSWNNSSWPRCHGIPSRRSAHWPCPS